MDRIRSTSWQTKMRAEGLAKDSKELRIRNWRRTGVDGDNGRQKLKKARDQVLIALMS